MFAKKKSAWLELRYLDVPIWQQTGPGWGWLLKEQQTERQTGMMTSVSQPADMQWTSQWTSIAENINSLSPMRYGSNLKCLILEPILGLISWLLQEKISFRKMLQDPTGNKPTFVQVMVSAINWTNVHYVSWDLLTYQRASGLNTIRSAERFHRISSTILNNVNQSAKTYAKP